MAKHSKSKRSHKNSSGQIRIVAGRWRGRKIPVLDAQGLRPTGDRVRETLFNWLQYDIPGSRCLDLFAGSGALGLEAASRGAASVVLVESSAAVARQLSQTLDALDASDAISLYTGTAQHFLDGEPGAFDVVFVDPPFDKQLHIMMLQRLTQGTLGQDALVYIEFPTCERDLLDALPDTLELAREKTFGDVSVVLLRKQS